MAYAVGTRVGACSHTTNTQIFLLGYGVYEGDKPHPILGIPNPYIALDDGTHLWGCECWWGEEAEFKEKMLPGKDVVHIRVRRDETGRGLGYEPLTAA